VRGIIVVAVFGVALVAAMRSRFAGLALYSWFALFRPQEWAWRTIDELHLSAIACAVLIIPSLLSGVMFDVAHPLTIGTFAFLGSAVLAQIGASDQALAWFYLKNLIPLVSPRLAPQS
jgi:hypothetical protein